MSNGSTTDLWTWQLMAQVESNLTGASIALTQSTYFEVLREFFDYTNIWQETISLTVIPDTLDYYLTPTSGRILRLWSVVDQNNTTQQAIMPIPATLHFLYPYSDTQPMTATVVKTLDDPLDSCFPPPDLPDWLVPQYGHDLKNGLIGMMMAIPNQPWSEPEIGKYFLQKFNNGMNHARVATRLANTVGAQVWIYPQQYRTTSQRGGVSTFNVNPTPAQLR